MRAKDLFNKATKELSAGSAIKAFFTEEQERETFRVGLYRERSKNPYSDIVISKGFDKEKGMFWVSLKKPAVPVEFILTTPTGEERRLT